MLEWSGTPFAKWFVGGRLNAAYNCIDRHVEAGRGHKIAIHWVGEPEGRESVGTADVLAGCASEVRTWARQHGLTVTDRGRLPASVVAAFRNSRDD